MAGSFISNRITTLCLPEYNTNASFIHTGIPWDLPLTPSLFLLYNANLVHMCNPLTITASKISFVGNVNALAYGKSTEKNCRTLHAVYDR